MPERFLIQAVIDGIKIHGWPDENYCDLSTITGVGPVVEKRLRPQACQRQRAVSIQFQGNFFLFLSPNLFLCK